jgi:hypothetical protein
MIKRSNEAITELTGDEVGLQEDIYYYSGKDKSIYEKAVFDNEFPKEPFNYTIWSAMEKYGGERLKNCDDKSNEKMLYLSTMFNSEFNPEKGTTFETFEKLKKFYSLNDDRLTYTAEHLHFKDDKIIFTIKGRKEWSYNKEKFSDEVGATNYIAEDYRGLDVHALKNEEVTIYVRKDMYGHPLYLMNGLYISDMDELRETLIRANSFSKVDWYMYDSKLQDYIRNHDVKQAEKPAPAPVKKVKKKGFNIADLKIKKSKEEPEI